VITVGMLMNPSGNTTEQEFHTDYQGKVAEIFIPFNFLTTKNSTQFISQELTSKPYSLEFFGKNSLDLLEREGVDYI
jgi:hypothetical protein